MALDEAEGRREFRAIAEDLQAVGVRLGALLLKAKRTRGYHRSLEAMRAVTPEGALPGVSLPFRWAGHLEVALTAVEDAGNEIRLAAGLKRRD